MLSSLRRSEDRAEILIDVRQWLARAGGSAAVVHVGFAVSENVSECEEDKCE